LRPAVAEFGGGEARVQPVGDSRFGDYQTNIAMTLAKAQRTNPRELAARIIAKLEVDDVCAPPEVAGAGFINFRLKAEALATRVARMLGDPRLGVPLPATAKRIVIDFSGPNIAKAMHVGHIRSTILGDAIARVAEFLGHSVVRDNHIGDWGTQFGMLLVGWKTMLEREALARDPIAELERLYKAVVARCETDPPLREVAKSELVKLQGGDEENLATWRQMIALSHAQFAEIYRRLEIRFDVELGESFYNPWLNRVVSQLRDRGIARESEGAICVFSDGTLPPKEDPFLIQRDGEWLPVPALILKEDGGANYTTTDLATLEYRLTQWNPDEIIYVTDGRQQLHFRQVFAIFRRWQPEAARTRLAHVWFGSILGENHKPFKTRSGESVKLADLLDEAEERAFALISEKSIELTEEERRDIARTVGLGAVKYADLLPNRQSDYVFSWDKMLSFQGNTAPYLQYSYVRICSIFRKAGLDRVPTGNQEAIFLPEGGEQALAKKLCQFGEVLPLVLDDHRPNVLANYLYELAAAFHAFFEACPVLKADAPLRASRLVLCQVTARVLAQGLALLGISVPERM